MLPPTIHGFRKSVILLDYTKVYAPITGQISHSFVTEGALAEGAGAASQNAIGIAVMGGMLAATFLAIFFVPMFYVAVEKLFHGEKAPRKSENP